MAHPEHQNGLHSGKQARRQALLSPPPPPLNVCEIYESHWGGRVIKDLCHSYFQV